MLGYFSFIAVGYIGINQPDGFGFTEKITYTPEAGLVITIAGCLAAGAGGAIALRHAEKPAS